MLTIGDLEDIVNQAVDPLETTGLSKKNLPPEVDDEIIDLINAARDCLAEASDILYDAKRGR